MGKARIGGLIRNNKHTDDVLYVSLTAYRVSNGFAIPIGRCGGSTYRANKQTLGTYLRETHRVQFRSPGSPGTGFGSVAPPGQLNVQTRRVCPRDPTGSTF